MILVVLFIASAFLTMHFVKIEGGSDLALAFSGIGILIFIFMCIVAKPEVDERRSLKEQKERLIYEYISASDKNDVVEKIQKHNERCDKKIWYKNEMLNFAVLVNNEYEKNKIDINELNSYNTNQEVEIDGKNIILCQQNNKEEFQMNNKRRKRIAEIIEKLNEIKEMIDEAEGGTSEIKDEEQEVVDNIPENLQNSERYNEAEAACEELENACDTLSEIADSIEDVISFLENAAE